MRVGNVRPDIIFLENVVGVNLALAETYLGDLWDIKQALIDPRPVAGVRMARERICGVGALRQTM